MTVWPRALGLNEAQGWLWQAALPLWAGVTEAGQPTRAGACEALARDGTPLFARPRRMRVHARQAHVFAAASHALLTHGAPEPARALAGRLRRLGCGLFGFVMARGWDGAGRLAGLTDARGHRLSAPHALYDLAFVMLAAASLTRCGVDTGPALVRLRLALARLSAARGWHENARHALPRGQNAHMHLFEAALELAEATGAPWARAVAETCLGLFHEAFSTPDGAVRELFDADWQPLGPGQRIEPGHVAEWIVLLDRYEQVTGAASGADFAAMARCMLAGRDGAGFLRDASAPALPTRRLWPQTEFLRASAVLARRGHRLPAPARPEALACAIRAQYLAGAVPGAWHDRLSETGALMSGHVPASGLYHLWGAFSAMPDLAVPTLAPPDLAPPDLAPFAPGPARQGGWRDGRSGSPAPGPGPARHGPGKHAMWKPAPASAPN